MTESSGPWGGTGSEPLAGRTPEHLVERPESSTAEVSSAVDAPPAATGRALRTLERRATVLRASITT